MIDKERRFSPENLQCLEGFDFYPRGLKPLEGRERVWGPIVSCIAPFYGTGKTTFVKVVNDQFNQAGFLVYPIWERPDDNPFLKASYKRTTAVDGGSLFSFLSQWWFITDKFEQWLAAPRDRETIIVTDLPPEGDAIFGAVRRLTGGMSEDHWRRYKEFHEGLSWNEIWPPDVIVYLTGSMQVLLDRNGTSAEDFEQGMSGDYLKALMKVNEWWLEQVEEKYKGTKVLKVSTDDFDFSDNGDPDNGRILTEKVAEVLTGLGFSQFENL